MAKKINSKQLRELIEARAELSRWALVYCRAISEHDYQVGESGEAIRLACKAEEAMLSAYQRIKQLGGDQ